MHAGRQQGQILRPAHPQAADPIEQQPDPHPPSGRSTQCHDDAISLFVASQHIGADLDRATGAVQQPQHGLQRRPAFQLKGCITAMDRCRHPHRGVQLGRPGCERLGGTPVATGRPDGSRIETPRLSLVGTEQLARAEHQEDRQGHVGHHQHQQHPGQRSRRRAALPADAGDHHIAQQADENGDDMAAEQQESTPACPRRRRETLITPPVPQGVLPLRRGDAASRILVPLS